MCGRGLHSCEHGCLARTLFSSLFAFKKGITGLINIFVNSLLLIPCQSFTLLRNASSLVIAEHTNSEVVPLTYNTISAAKQIGGDVTVLLAGKECSKVGATIFFVTCYIYIQKKKKNK